MSATSSEDKKAQRDYCGTSGSVLRLGRAMSLRQKPVHEYEALAAQEASGRKDE